MNLSKDPQGLVISWQMSPGRTTKCAPGEVGSHKYKTSIASYGGNQIPVTFYLKLDKPAEVKKTRKWKIISCVVTASGELCFVLTPAKKNDPVDILQIVPRPTAGHAGEISIEFKLPTEVHQKRPRRQPRTSVFVEAETAFAS